MGDSAYKDNDGRSKFYPITQPHDTAVHNSGMGHSRKKAIISLIAIDVKQSVTFNYDDTIQLHKASIAPIGAPLGSYINIRSLDNDGSIKEHLCNGLLLYGDKLIIIESQRLIKITSLEKLRVTVYNSDGTGVEDSAAAFRVLINFTMFR